MQSIVADTSSDALDQYNGHGSMIDNVLFDFRRYGHGGSCGKAQVGIPNQGYHIGKEDLIFLRYDSKIEELNRSPQHPVCDNDIWKRFFQSLWNVGKAAGAGAGMVVCWLFLFLAIASG